MAESLSTMSGVAVDDGFDYGPVNDQWVTHPDIGRALAERVDCVAKRSAANNGPGKVVIVAHSMGGLATRCAASTKCTSGGPEVADKIGAVITLGTPNTGSFLRGNAVVSGAEQVLLKSLALNCWALQRVTGDLCEMRHVMEGPAAVAFTPGSSELKKLPDLPPEIPVEGIAGKVSVTTQLFNQTYTLTGNAGDLVVSVPSALAGARDIGGLGGPDTIDCGTAPVPVTRGWTPPTCWHGTETSSPLFKSKVRATIQKYLDKHPVPPPKTTAAPSTSPPAAVPTPAAAGWDIGDQVAAKCSVAWPTAPTRTTTSIEMRMTCLGQPSSFLFVDVDYGDPDFPINPSTGFVSVYGTVTDQATSGFGFRTIEVHAERITIP
jgi:pimeloyl-ACP methyl ester carboxylesterase